MGVDADESDPRLALAGDRNWECKRVGRADRIGDRNNKQRHRVDQGHAPAIRETLPLADGSVQKFTSSQLRQWLVDAVTHEEHQLPTPRVSVIFTGVLPNAAAIQLHAEPTRFFKSARTVWSRRGVFEDFEVRLDDAPSVRRRSGKSSGHQLRCSVRPCCFQFLPAHQHARPAFITVFHSGLRVLEFLQIPVAADAGVEHLVGPIVILKQPRKRVLRSDAHLPFVTLAGRGIKPCSMK